MKIHRKFPFGGQTVLAHFSISTGVQYHRELEALMRVAHDETPLQPE